MSGARRLRPPTAVNELTLTNAPFGIVRGKTGGLARAPRRRSAGQSRAFAPQPETVLAGSNSWRCYRQAKAISAKSVTTFLRSCELTYGHVPRLNNPFIEPTSTHTILFTSCALSYFKLYSFTTRYSHVFKLSSNLFVACAPIG